MEELGPARLEVAMTVEQLWQPAPGGSGTYIAELAESLAQRPDVRLHARSGLHLAPPSRPLPASMRRRPTPLPRAVLYELWSNRTFRALGSRTSALRADILHATTWAMPPRTAPLAVTVHDLAFLRDSSHFTARGNRFFRRALEIVRDEADVVIVPSAVTADDCAAHGIERTRVHVIHHGVRVPLASSPQDLETFRAQHGLRRPYVLWCGTFEPRKNVTTLLEAFGQVAEDEPELDLVLAGPSGWGAAAADVRERARSVPAGRVHVLGHLAARDLDHAYSAARAFCFPSLWEGFGMPVLEAMGHGLPVVTSAGTSMQEISGSAALLVDPVDADALATAILTAVGPRHAELSAAARDQAALFTWERSAAQHVDAYRAAAAA